MSQNLPNVSLTVLARDAREKLVDDHLRVEVVGPSYFLTKHAKARAAGSFELACQNQTSAPTQTVNVRASSVLFMIIREQLC
jgi:hypothetical protein